MGTRQATARDMLNTIKQRCFMLSDPCHVEKDNAGCLFPAKCIGMCTRERVEETISGINLSLSISFPRNTFLNIF